MLGAGPASRSRGLDQGAARGEFGPRGPPRSFAAWTGHRGPVRFDPLSFTVKACSRRRTVGSMSCPSPSDRRLSTRRTSTGSTCCAARNRTCASCAVTELTSVLPWPAYLGSSDPSRAIETTIAMARDSTIGTDGQDHHEGRLPPRPAFRPRPALHGRHGDDDDQRQERRPDQPRHGTPTKTTTIAAAPRRTSNPRGSPTRPGGACAIRRCARGPVHGSRQPKWSAG